MKFRTDISFLRALSVIIVMLFHFNVPFFKGGFIGVDVFFVISGFLMTQIIVKNIETNNFSLKEFYKRRIIRIIPPLMWMLLLVIIISIFLFIQSDLRLNAKYAALANLFVSNIYFWKYIDYFSSTDNILIHTWSLGVEWQFYLFYPILLLLTSKWIKRSQKFLFVFISLLTIISFWVMIYSVKNDTRFAFYMLPARFWELSIGGIAFLLGSHNRLPLKIKKIATYFTIIMLIVSVYFFSDKILWPSIYTLIPVLCTVLILSMNINSKIFNNSFTLFFGKISYSLYLWHWPLFITFKYFDLLSSYYIVLLTLLSIGFAYVSYKCIEKNKKISNPKTSIIFIVLISIIGIFLYVKPNNIITNNLTIYKNEKFKIANYITAYEAERDKQFNPCGCFVTNNQTIKDYNFENCLKFSNTKKNILLIGDSHAAQYSSSLRKNNEYNLLEVSLGFVFPIINSKGEKDNKKLMDSIYQDFIPKNKNKIDLVLISAHWLMKDDSRINMSTDQVKKGILEIIAYFEKNNINYMFIGQTESYSYPYPKVLLFQNFDKKEVEFLNKNSFSMNQLLKEMVPKEHYIDVYNNNFIKKINYNKAIPYMFDSNHLSKFGADQVIDKLVIPRVNNNLALLTK